MDFKRCPQCGQAKPRGLEFFCANKRSKDGFACYCKECHSAKFKAFYAANREAMVARAVKQVARRRLSNPEYDRSLAREAKRRKLADPLAYQEHLKRGREWCKANPERVKLFKHQSPERKAARTAARDAAKLRATPVWADRQAIAAVYATARTLTAATGIEHHVDHVVPLRGRTASGLHVHTNLRAIPKADNARKGNRLIPELFGA